MALFEQIKETKFGVGDKVKVIQKIKEGEKTRLQTFEGMVIKIKGRDAGRSFTVRRIGEGQIGIERIFPILASSIEKIEVVKKGTSGVRHAKLYYTRQKSRREIDVIYSRLARKNQFIESTSKKASRKKSTKKR